MTRSLLHTEGGILREIKYIRGDRFEARAIRSIGLEKGEMVKVITRTAGRVIVSHKGMLHVLDRNRASMIMVK